MIVDVYDLLVGYGSRPVANAGRFRVEPGRVTAVIGPNGSGKTTLLKTLAGLLRPLAGRIVPGPVPGSNGVVLVHSLPFMFVGTVRKNLQLAARGNESPARQALRAFGLEHLWAVDVEQLSAGQRQRVALARGLAADPQVLLVDEPEAGLDPDAIALWRLVVQVAVSTGRPSIVMASTSVVPMEGIPCTVITLGRRG
jgi:ABC-type multidrug transport system ATPase subunit